MALIFETSPSTSSGAKNSKISIFQAKPSHPPAPHPQGTASRIWSRTLATPQRTVTPQPTRTLRVFARFPRESLPPNLPKLWPPLPIYQHFDPPSHNSTKNVDTHQSFPDFSKSSLVYFDPDFSAPLPSTDADFHGFRLPRTKVAFPPHTYLGGVTKSPRTPTHFACVSMGGTVGLGGG